MWSYGAPDATRQPPTASPIDGEEHVVRRHPANRHPSRLRLVTAPHASDAPPAQLNTTTKTNTEEGA